MLSDAGFRHAFFLRGGGVSPPPYDSLNLSWTVGDLHENVAHNLTLAAKVLGLTPQQVFFLFQTHGTACHVVSAASGLQETRTTNGDALISLDPSIALGVRTADCAPVFVADRRTGAVAAIHSGWRGTQQNVVRAAFQTLRASSSAPIDPIACVGPHIEECCFEVGLDVASMLQDTSPVGGVVTNLGHGKARVDLRRIIHSQLRQEGVPDDCIDHVRGCTVCDRGRFFSYRRDGKKSGRHLNVIVARRASL